MRASVDSMAVLWLLLVTLCASPTVAIVPTVQWPLAGQGVWPRSLGRAVVTVHPHLERILSVNQAAQSWRAVHRFHLSWRDPRAQAALYAGTQAWWNSTTTNSAYGSCTMPCDASLSFESGCCDLLWLPQLDLPNLLDFDYQVNPPQWRIWVEPETLPDGTPSSIVHWTVRLDGTWFSPFDFRAWPLEHQHLLIEMQPANTIADKVSLYLGSIDPLLNTPHTKGVDIAGWRITHVTPRLFDTSSCFRRSNTTSWVLDLDEQTGSFTSRAITPTNYLGLFGNSTVVTQVEEKQCSSINVEGTAGQYGPYVLVIDMQIKRTEVYYVLIFIVPLIIVDLLVFVVYSMDRTNIEARLGIIVTLVLALSALQFTYDFPPASYMNIVQQLSLVSYVLFGLVAIFCILTCSIARIHERKARLEATLVAAGLKSLRDTQSRIDAQLAYDLGLDRVGKPPPPPPPPPKMSGLFFGTASSRAADAYKAPRVTANAPPMRAAGGAASATNVPPAAEVDADFCPPSQRSERQSTAEAPGFPGSSGRSQPGTGHGVSLGPGPVAEGTMWPSVLVLTGKAKGKDDKRQQEQQEQRRRQQQQPAERPNEDGGAGDPEDPGYLDQPSVSKKQTAWERMRQSVSSFFTKVTADHRQFQSRIGADEAYAQLVARRLDIVSSVVLLICYFVTVTTLISVCKGVGDHRLMLAGASAPGNM